MLRRIFGLATVAVAVVGWGNSVKAQGYTAPGVGPIVATNGELVGNYSGGSRVGVLQPAYYAAEFLTASPSYPWVIAPRYSSHLPWTSGLNWGYHTSSYGDYSRYVYGRPGTGIFPGLERPYMRVENDRCHHNPPCDR